MQHDIRAMAPMVFGDAIEVPVFLAAGRQWQAMATFERVLAVASIGTWNMMEILGRENMEGYEEPKYKSQLAERKADSFQKGGEDSRNEPTELRVYHCKSGSVND